MKKAIAILLILSISLFFVVGCSSGSETVRQPDQNNQNPDLKQNQQEDESDEIPPLPALPE